MKKLFLIFLFSGSLDSFSQVPDPSVPLREYNWSADRPAPTPDTLRAIILVTLSPNGVAHARMGFVVIDGLKEVVYLDCNKRALKLPRVWWGYKIAGGR